MYVGCDKDSGGGDGVEMGTVTVGMGKTLWAWGGDCDKIFYRVNL